MPPGVTASVGAAGAIGEVPSAMVCLQTRLGLVCRKIWRPHPIYHRAYLPIERLRRPGPAALRRLQLDILIGRPRVQVEIADGMLDDARTDPHEGAEIVDRREHHPVDRQLLD